MPRIAAIATARAVLAAVSPILVARGFRKTDQDQRSLATNFEKQLNTDVRQLVALSFFDGPIAAKNIVWMTGTMGLASEALLREYRRLTRSESTGYYPVGLSFDHLHQQYGAGGWKFELPDLESSVDSFRSVFDEQIDPLARHLDSAEKQAMLLVAGPYKNAYWNPAFFKPIALLMLGRNVEAAKCVREVFGAASDDFAVANKDFIERVLRDAA